MLCLMWSILVSFLLSKLNIFPQLKSLLLIKANLGYCSSGKCSEEGKKKGEREKGGIMYEDKYKQMNGRCKETNAI